MLTFFYEIAYRYPTSVRKFVLKILVDECGQKSKNVYELY